MVRQPGEQDSGRGRSSIQATNTSETENVTRYDSKWELAPRDRPYRIRESRSPTDLDAVHRITHDSLVDAGSLIPLPGGRLISYPKIDRLPQTTVLVATIGAAVVGTNTLMSDGPAGLHTDVHFRRETDRIRGEGRRLISSFRIATDPKHPATQGIALILDLIRWTYFIGINKYRFETCLFTFNPKHEPIYKRLIAARTVARRECMPGSPIATGVVLMRIDWERTPSRILRELGELNVASRDEPPIVSPHLDVRQGPGESNAPAGLGVADVSRAPSS